jgi:hypothetical protein
VQSATIPAARHSQALRAAIDAVAEARRTATSAENAARSAESTSEELQEALKCKVAARQSCAIVNGHIEPSLAIGLLCGNLHETSTHATTTHRALFHSSTSAKAGPAGGGHGESAEQPGKATSTDTEGGKRVASNTSDLG